jgi:hypothetical protein
MLALIKADMLDNIKNIVNAIRGLEIAATPALIARENWRPNVARLAVLVCSCRVFAVLQFSAR